MPEFTSYGAPTTPLSGTELVLLAQGGSTKTGTVAQLMTAPMTPSSLTTTGAVIQQFKVSLISNTAGMTIPAADMVNGYLERQAASAAFSDTTDTATNIIAQIANAAVDVTFIFRILNQTGYTMTLAGGTGVTINGTATIASGAWRDMLGQVLNVSSPSVSFTNVGGGTN